MGFEPAAHPDARTSMATADTQTNKGQLRRLVPLPTSNPML